MMSRLEFFFDDLDKLTVRAVNRTAYLVTSLKFSVYGRMSKKLVPYFLLLALEWIDSCSKR